MNDKRNIKMLTINQAAQVVPGLTKFRIREMCIKGEIPCIKAGRKYLICEQMLVRHLTEPPTALQPQPDNTIRRIDYIHSVQNGDAR